MFLWMYISWFRREGLQIQTYVLFKDSIQWHVVCRQLSTCTGPNMRAHCASWHLVQRTKVLSRIHKDKHCSCRGIYGAQKRQALTRAANR
jgi:hypothetical protein